jgi:hypothetical protein
MEAASGAAAAGAPTRRSLGKGCRSHSRPFPRPRSAGAPEFIKVWAGYGGNLLLRCTTPDAADDMPGAEDPQALEQDFLEQEIEAADVSLQTFLRLPGGQGPAGLGTGFPGAAD